MSLAARLWELFRGLDRAHGKYAPRVAARPGEKVPGSALTIRSPVTVELWQAHLDGRYGLGVVPIRENSTASWGAIDVDVYTGLDHKKMAADVTRLAIPVIVARTKSGGAHLYLFLSEPAPAELVRGRLMEWSVALGYAGVEIFPKQAQLTDSENDLGNWLNMPYYAGERTTRYALASDGQLLTTEQFVAAAEAARLTVAELRARQIVVDARVTDLLAEGPPCLQSLSIHGFPQGTRNNAMFNIAVYLRKRFSDDWADHLEEYNEKFMQPPLTRREIVAIRRSVGKRAYNYKCNDQPICQACSRQICLSRRFGVGGDDEDPGVVFGDLVQVITEPDVSYIWDVDGVRIEFSNSRQILDQRMFHQLAMDRVKKLPNFVSEKVWRGIVREKLAKAEVIVPPQDTTPGGQLFEHLRTFVNQKTQARELDELLLGRPYTNGVDSCFRLRDFIDHLKRYRVSGFNEKELYNWLRRIGAKSANERLKGQSVRFWKIETPDRQTENFKVPTVEAGELDK